MGQHVETGRLVGSDQNFPLGSGIDLGNCQFGFVVQTQQPLGVVEKHVPRLGQVNLLADAIEEPGSQLFFQHSDLGADGRLGAEEFLGGNGKASVDRHGMEVANLIEVHVKLRSAYASLAPDHGPLAGASKNQLPTSQHAPTPTPAGG